MEQQMEQQKFIENIKKSLQQTVNYKTNKAEIVNEYILQRTKLSMLVKACAEMKQDVDDTVAVLKDSNSNKLLLPNKV